MSDILEKWECNTCEHQFLVNKESASGKKFKCPYCRKEAIAVASSDPETAEEIRDEMGCLFVSK